MSGDSNIYLWCLVLLFSIQTSNSQCTTPICEKKSLSLKTNTKHNYSLEGYIFDTLNFSIWKECYNMCMRKCQCLSFNFNEAKKNENCELNDANTKLVPEALKEKEGFSYYEPVRTYYDKNGGPRQTCSDPTCHNKCCDSTPCQHGGTCHEVCDVTKRRYNCTCPPGFSGHKCQIRPPPRSCKDVMMLEKVKNNGIYNILDQNKISFPVYCDFGSEPGAVWTLIQSYSLENKNAFMSKAFFLHDMPINQDAPEWNSYRLSMSRLKFIRNVSTHWRATCDFSTSGVDYRDYWRVSLESLDLTVDPRRAGYCIVTEFVNVRGNQCTNCSVWGGYDSQWDPHLDSWLSSENGCSFNGRSGGIYGEDNFGVYYITNPAFRCTSSVSSTTQLWLGSF